MKYYYMYQITNLVNGKIYIGVHQTNNFGDNYMGSGTLLLKAYKKYGRENFKKDILEFFTCVDDMFKKEVEIVTVNFISQPNVYNCGVGGKGGAKFKGHKHSEETKAKIRQSLLGQVISEEIKDKQKKKQLELSPEYRKERARKAGSYKKSEEHKQKISQSLQGKLRGHYKKVICPHCSKEGAINGMKRWHFDNCKYKLQQGELVFKKVS